MVELISTIIVTAGSALLFAYWFRYTCLLILSTKTARDYTGQVAAANQLGFLQVQSQLRADSGELDALREVLDRDYAVLARLLRQPGGANPAAEERMLDVNYRLMAAWYGFSRQFSPRIARKALEEMSLVLAHFANALGERADCAAAA